MKIIKKENHHVRTLTCTPISSLTSVLYRQVDLKQNRRGERYHHSDIQTHRQKITDNAMAKKTQDKQTEHCTQNTTEN